MPGSSAPRLGQTSSSRPEEREPDNDLTAQLPNGVHSHFISSAQTEEIRVQQHSKFEKKTQCYLYCLQAQWQGKLIERGCAMSVIYM